MFKLVTIDMLKETQDKIILDNTSSLSAVMQVGNTASKELNMNTNAIINVADISGQTINLRTSSLTLNGESGTLGKVITVDNTGKPIWGEGNQDIPTLSQVMQQGNTAGTNLNMNLYSITNVNTITSGSGIGINDSQIILNDESINLNTTSLEFNGIGGEIGQYLSIDETGPVWVDATTATTPSLAQVMSVGNTAGTTLNMNNNDIIRVHGISGSTIYLTTDTLYVNGSSGTTGQVLSVGGAGPTWTSITSATTPSLAQVMAVGNTAGETLDMNNNDIIRVHGISGSTIYLTTNSLYINGSSGTTGQVLSVGGAGPTWTSITSATTPSLAQVMAVGNTAGETLDMNNNDIINVSGISGSNIYLTTNSLYINGSTGTPGQVLSVGGAGPTWTSITSATTPSLAQVMAVGNTAGTTLDMNNNDIINVRGISGNNIYLTTNSLYVNGSSGTTGQVLSVGGAGPTWTSITSVTTPSLAQVMSVGNTTGTTLNMNNNDIINVYGISGSTFNINSTNLTNNIVNIGSTASIINCFPIHPSSEITYNTNTGTGITGTIGYVYTGSTSKATANSGQLYKQVNFSIPPGIYMVSNFVSIQNHYDINTTVYKAAFNVGSGESENTGADVISYIDVNFELGTTSETGKVYNKYITTIFIATTSVYLSSSATIYTNSNFYDLQTSVLKAVRIA